MGTDTSVIKKQKKFNDMVWNKKKIGKHQNMKKKAKEKHWTPVGCVCLAIKDKDKIRTPKISPDRHWLTSSQEQTTKKYSVQILGTNI